MNDILICSDPLEEHILHIEPFFRNSCPPGYMPNSRNATAESQFSCPKVFLWTPEHCRMACSFFQWFAFGAKVKVCLNTSRKSACQVLPTSVLTFRSHFMPINFVSQPDPSSILRALLPCGHESASLSNVVMIFTIPRHCRVF